MTPRTVSLPSPPHAIPDTVTPWDAKQADVSTLPSASGVEASGLVVGERFASTATVADPVEVRGLRREIYRWFELCGMDEETCQLMQLAFAELGANVIEHGPRHEGAWMQVTWSVQQMPGDQPRAVVSVLDCGDGISCRAGDADQPDDDALPGLATGRRGLRMLLGSGARIERLVLAASPGWPGGHLVSAWTPLQARARRRVCACPCWEHGYAAVRCQQIAQGARTRVRGLAGGSVSCCQPCAAALRARRQAGQALDALRALSGQAHDALAGLGAVAHRLSSAVADARRTDLPIADIASALAGLGRSEDLLEIACTDLDGSKLLWQLAALLAVPDESRLDRRALASDAREPLEAVA